MQPPSAQLETAQKWKDTLFLEPQNKVIYHREVNLLCKIKRATFLC